ncbi:MAG: hypothetical protein FK732_06465 [Asgard group archaeon]|nr:hypothetical protein [Asgard group archaeon]
MAEVTDLHVLAKMSQGSPNEEDAFIVRGDNDKVIAKIHNLSELLDVLSDIDPDKIFPNLCRIKDKEIECDLALWVHYVLGDAVLSAKIYNIVKTKANDPGKLKLEVFNLCFNRYLNFRELIESSDNFLVDDDPSPPTDI